MIWYFYPRSPCGERLPADGHSGQQGQKFLSTLSLRRATGRNISLLDISLFLSTLSLRRATDSSMKPQLEEGISIHALLAESDIHHRTRHQSPSYFYPRSPCGERPVNIRSYGNNRSYFYPRSPCGERQRYEYQPTKFDYFYPRSPCGERQLRMPVPA